MNEHTSSKSCLTVSGISMCQCKGTTKLLGKGFSFLFSASPNLSQLLPIAALAWHVEK